MAKVRKFSDIDTQLGPRLYAVRDPLAQVPVPDGVAPDVHRGAAQVRVRAGHVLLQAGLGDSADLRLAPFRFIRIPCNRIG